LSLVDHYMVTSAFGRALPNYCNDLGINFALIAKKFGIEEIVFRESDSQVNLISFGAMLEYLAELTADDAFGLKFGLNFTPGDSGPFGFGLMNAPDMGQAIRFMARYISLVADTIDFNFIEEPNHCRIEWTYSPLFVAKDQYVDLVVLLAIFHLRQFVEQNWRPIAVRLQRSPPSSIHLHQLYISSNLSFDAERNVIEFSCAQVSKTNPNADHRLYEIMQHQCEAKLEQRLKKVPLQIQIREKILSSLDIGGVSLVDVAKQLCMTERSLQRRLAETGTHFESVTDEVRQELSEQLLLHSKLTRSQIGSKLGFSTPGSYSRAAKRWSSSRINTN
jgi:AraC-like DNA-binding protein